MDRYNLHERLVLAVVQVDYLRAWLALCRPLPAAPAAAAEAVPAVVDEAATHSPVVAALAVAKEVAARYKDVTAQVGLTCSTFHVPLDLHTTSDSCTRTTTLMVGGWVFELQSLGQSSIELHQAASHTAIVEGTTLQRAIPSDLFRRRRQDATMSLGLFWPKMH